MHFNKNGSSLYFNLVEGQQKLHALDFLVEDSM